MVKFCLGRLGRGQSPLNVGTKIVKIGQGLSPDHRAQSLDKYGNIAIYCSLFASEKNSFLLFSRKLNVLDSMLLHRTYINVAFAHILLHGKGLYDLQGQSYEFRKMTLLVCKNIKKTFFAIFSKTKRFSVYVDS